MKILIGADLVPTDTNQDLFAAADGNTLVGRELLSILKSADYRIFNLEVPLTDTEAPIEKCGPNLIAPTASICGYQALGADLLTVANNHIMDQGEQGLFSTMKLLEESGIAFVGGGQDLASAQAPYIVELGIKKVGIYACAEHEFSIAREDKPGANPFDPLESPDHVTQLKTQCDYVIVLYHGGKEHYRYPSPNLQKTCRKLVEKGADLVVCQHSHCIGCEEKYLHGTIVYGQGNFLFDHSKSEFWQTGLLIGLDENFSLSYIPLRKAGNTVHLAEGAGGEKILSEFEDRSARITREGFLQKQYAKFASTYREQYLLTISSWNTRSIFFRGIQKLTGGRWGRWLIRQAYRKEKLLAVRNYIECEAHRELFLQGLEEKHKR